MTACIMVWAVGTELNKVQGCSYSGVCGESTGECMHNGV